MKIAVCCAWVEVPGQIQRNSDLVKCWPHGRQQPRGMGSGLKNRTAAYQKFVSDHGSQTPKSVAHC